MAVHMQCIKKAGWDHSKAEQLLCLALQTALGADGLRRLALLSIGRIGRCASLADFPQMQGTLTAALTSSSEDIKAAASLALGSVAIGDLDTHLPFIIRQIREQVSSLLHRAWHISGQCSQLAWLQNTIGCSG